MTDLQRLAEAAWEASWKDDSADVFGSPEGYVPLVRSVLEAMREPTPGMYQALADTGKMWRELSSIEVWQTYIDHILNDGKQDMNVEPLPQDDAPEKKPKPKLTLYLNDTERLSARKEAVQLALHYGGTLAFAEEILHFLMNGTAPAPEPVPEGPTEPLSEAATATSGRIVGAS